MSWVMTTEEAAEHVGVSPVTIRRWVMKQWLEPLVRGSKPLRFSVADVTRCFASHQPQGWHDALDHRWGELLADAQPMGNDRA